MINFTRALQEAGHEVHLIVASEMPLMGRFARMSKTTITQLPAILIVLGDLVRLGCMLWTGAVTFARTIGRPSPEFVYERAAVMQSLTSFHAAKRRSFRVVEANGILSRETGSDRNALRFEALARAIERHVFRKADLLVVVSASLKREVIEFAGVPDGRVLVVPNGVDSAILDIDLDRRGNRTIGFVGQLSHWQRLDGLVEALARIGNENPDLVPNVEIIGDGPARAPLTQRIDELKLNNCVQVLGRMPQDEAFARMASWSIGFAGHEKSSSAEMYHSPLKLYEYAGLGLDVVCTSTSDASALAECGLRIELYGEDRSLDEALLAALGLPARTINEISSVRESVARAHSWSQRVSLVTTAISRWHQDATKRGGSA